MKSLKELALLGAVVLSLAGCGRTAEQASEQEPEAPRNLLYGIDADEYRIEKGEVNPGQTLGGILGGYGVTAGKSTGSTVRHGRSFPCATSAPGIPTPSLSTRIRSTRPMWTTWLTNVACRNTWSSDFTGIR